KRINININVIEPENNFTGISVDQKFDLIICSDLYVFGDIAVATLNITKHLADGGILLLNESVPCVSQFFLNGLKPYFADKFLSSKNCGTTLYDFDEWKQLFTNLNLNLINKTFDFEDLYLGRFTAIYEKHSDNIAEMKVDAGLEDSDDDLLYLIVGRSDDERVSSLEKVIESNHKNSNIILYDKDITSYKEINYLKYSNIVFLPADKIDIDDVSLDCYIMDMVKEIAKLSVNRKLNISLVTSGGLLGNNKSDLNLIRNPKHASLWALMRVVSNEFNNFINVKLIDLQTVEINRELINLLENESEDELLLTEKSVYSMRVDKLLNLTDETSNEDQVVRLEINKKGSLNNLQWIEDSKQTLTENDVAFKPMAVGLNFRDIMYSLGLIPEEVVENSNVGSSLGLDVAGIVIDVGENVTKFKPGDRLMGGAPGSISNYNVFNQDSLFKLPDSWNFKDGATIFTVFFTAYCSLVHLARVRKGETLLIHGAAGGVGLAAIQISKYLGVEVYATAGSPEKRDFLRLMGVDHIYDSRSLKFMEEIKNDTEGKGVDVILNSLAAEAIEANLKLLKPFGRFVEMGKRDIYENYKMGLKPFRNNLSYFCINIEQITIWREELGLDIFKDLNKLFNEGVLKPLPYRIFKPEKVKEAFKYLQTARHIGKVVIDMEDSKITTGINKASKLSLSGTYLVTGGTNGFGLDTAKWLTEKGVKELILISRSGKINSEELDYFKNKNCNIILRSVDVNSQDQIKTLFQEIETLNIPLKGIIHAAAVYEDELIENLSESAYKKVLFTKIKGAYYLDKLSRKFNLEHFIVYSSVTALFGNIGQANYVAANGYLESLALERRRLGLNANYIALGGILDTGLLTRNASLKKVLTSQMGEGLITVEQALMALDCLISSPVPGFAVMNINVQQMEKTIPIFKTSRFDILRLTENKKSDSKNIDFKIYLKDLSYEEAKEEVLQIVREEIAAVLDISTDEINVKTLIKEFGFDSLMGFDLAVSIEKRIGVSIPPLSLQQTPNAEKIADILLPRLLDDHEEDDGEIETALYSKHGEE
ncbi:MAG: SDR family NAD(P)-dependent oxidoreductase, partial [bacterium]|nr:SDR family NAD(P)-dependent oxidoreductase [bacterium]